MKHLNSMKFYTSIKIADSNSYKYVLPKISQKKYFFFNLHFYIIMTKAVHVKYLVVGF